MQKPGRSPGSGRPFDEDGGPAAAGPPSASGGFMLNYCLRRLAMGLVMLVALSILIFILLRLAPGDPVAAYINPSVATSQAPTSEARTVRKECASTCTPRWSPSH